MLNKNIFIKILVSLLLVLFYLFFINEVNAAQDKVDYTGTSSIDESKYPGYVSLIENLRKEYPNWEFELLYTGLDWSQVIKNETVVVHGRNLISSGYTGEWICGTCGTKAYDSGSWYCASETTVSYYMDPRNFLYEESVFQFESLSWTDGIYTVEGIQNILSGCKYADGSTVTYITTTGATETINKSLAQIIYDAGKANDVSPYHLASRIRQEIGTGNGSSIISGNYSSEYTGYYNYFNIGATGSNATSVITSGLTYAKSNNWTTPEIAINAGASFLAKSYIAVGQSTLYLQKFDVDDSDGTLYYHQYMQNVQAATTESITVLKTYKEADSSLNTNFKFLIPIYENMPETASPLPGTQTIVTQNVKINASNVNIRATSSTSGSILQTVSSGTQLLRIEIGNTKINGYYWDKVVLSDGSKGYVATGYLTLVDDITNCNIQSVINTSVNLRNGPGTTGTTVITTLVAGQTVTVIEKGKYDELNDYNWYRVELSDGRQGYIISSCVSSIGDSSDDNTDDNAGSTEFEYAIVTATSLNLRDSATTSGKILTTIKKGEMITVLNYNVATANGYTWAQVVTQNGVTGYVAVGGSNGSYLEEYIPSNTTVNGTGVKISGNNLICEPTITVDTLLKNNSSFVVKNSSGTTITTGNLATGQTVTVNGTTYTVIKLGDVNKDGSVTMADYLQIKNYLLEKLTLDNSQKISAELTGDSSISMADYLQIKNYLLEKVIITI